MRYIKARLRLNSPSADEFTIYGWETEWMKKAEIIDGEPVERGDLVRFQPVTVQPNGKFVFPATKHNINLAKAMMSKKQLALAPGEKLEAPEAVEVTEVEDKWPDPPSAKTEGDDVAEADGTDDASSTGIDMVAMEAAGAAAERPDNSAVPKSPKRRPRKPSDLVPDTEA